MIDRESQLKYYKDYRLSFVCLALCGIMFVVLGVLPKIPSTIVRLLRPAFIIFSLLALKNGRYYELGATKFHIVNLVYYTIIFFSYSITSNAIEVYISMALFIVFFLFAVNRQWSKREIKWILASALIACDVQSASILYCNPGMFRNGGSSHLIFWGVTVNRNPVGYAIAIGATTGMLLLLYDKNCKIQKKILYLLSCLLCSFTVFTIGCRGAFLSAAVGMLCVVWQKTREGRNSTERVGRKLVAILMIFAVLLAAVYVSKGTYSSRLFESIGDTSGRDQIWEKAWALIEEKPLFGGGYDYWQDFGTGMGTHNTFILIMLYSGYVGAVLLGLFFLAILIECLKTRNLIPIGFLTETILHSLAETSLDYYGYIPIILAVIIARYIKCGKMNSRVFEL